MLVGLANRILAMIRHVQEPALKVQYTGQLGMARREHVEIAPVNGSAGGQVKKA